MSPGWRRGLRDVDRCRRCRSDGRWRGESWLGQLQAVVHPRPADVAQHVPRRLRRTAAFAVASSTTGSGGVAATRAEVTGVGTDVRVASPTTDSTVTDATRTRRKPPAGTIPPRRSLPSTGWSPRRTSARPPMRVARCSTQVGMPAPPRRGTDGRSDTTVTSPNTTRWTLAPHVTTANGPTSRCWSIAWSRTASSAAPASGAATNASSVAAQVPAGPTGGRPTNSTASARRASSPSPGATSTRAATSALIWRPASSAGR